jgi:hypothetical protein
MAARSLAACLTGCAGRERSSARCEWPSEPAVLLDLANLAQARHLRDDARAAELSAVRYADATEGSTRVGQHRQAMERCEGLLFDEIARVHHVAPAQVRTALARQNDTPF